MSAAVFRGLFDDASLFPPAGLAMAAAVTGHERHRTAWYREMTGPFVCPDTGITELGAALTAAGVAELDLALVLPGGAASLDQAVDTVFADPRLRLRAVEVPASAVPAAGNVQAESDGGDLAAAVASAVAALDRTPLAGATAFIEVPVGQLTAAIAQPAAEHRYLIKLRTGGTAADAFPSSPELAAALVTLAEERLAFKCTAGLHHAVRHRAADTGFEHHGFLNVLLAVTAALDGRGPGQVAAELADTDSGAVAARVSQLDPDTAAAARDLFTSFGTCSTDEPVADLVTLGLVTKG
jgi:hypothetical protein